MDPLISTNPSNGKIIKSYPQISDQELNDKINKSFNSQISWKETSIKSRLDRVRDLSEVLMDKKREYSVLMAEEMGKPIKQGEAEIEKCMFLCKYFIQNTESYLQDKIVQIDGQKSFVSIQPIGLVLGIMPWNFPFWQVFREGRDGRTLLVQPSRISQWI